MITEHGSVENWDSVWHKLTQMRDHSHRVLFVRGRPQTVDQFWQRGYFEDLIRFVKDNKYQSFLELGSGRGTTSMYLAEAGYDDITLVDLSDTALLLAKEIFQEEGLKVPVLVEADVESTGLEAEKFDCIYNIGLLEHFENPQNVLREAFRLLKPGGMIFMPIVPDLPYYKSIGSRLLFNPLSLVKRLIKYLLRLDRKVHKEMTRTSRTREEYAKDAVLAGFSDVQCMPYNPYWKVNSHRGGLGESMMLRVYQWHYGVVKRRGRHPALRTSKMTELCYLLIGFKK